MATRICIMGNSHVACLREAWDTYQDKSDSIALDFFAAPATGLAALELKDGCIGTTDDRVRRSLRITSGGRDSLRLADYDAFLLMDLRVRVPRLVRAISSAVAAQCSEDAIAASIGLPLGLMVRSQTDASIYVGHAPLFASDKPQSRLRSYDELYDVMVAKLARHDLLLLRQPAETILYPCSTHMRFSVGSSRLLPHWRTGETLKQPPEDVGHMNSAYGQLFLRDFFQRLNDDRSMGDANRP